MALDGDDLRGLPLSMRKTNLCCWRVAQTASSARRQAERSLA